VGHTGIDQRLRKKESKQTKMMKTALGLPRSQRRDFDNVKKTDSVSLLSKQEGSQTQLHRNGDIEEARQPPKGRDH